jgi:hypothetical protein
MSDNEAQVTELRTLRNNLDGHLSQLEDYRSFLDGLTISSKQATTLVSLNGYFVSIKEQLQNKRKQVLNDLDKLTNAKG